MTSNLFSTIDELRAVVKINASMPWSSIQPYLTSAWDFYMLQYFTPDFLDSVPDTDTTFLLYSRRAIGPLAIALSADEMTISIGDAGITVQNDNDKRSVASDKKINNAKTTMLTRGYNALSHLIAHVLSGSYDWASCPKLALINRLIVNNLQHFETYVSLGNDYVAFVELLPLLLASQNKLRKRVGDEVFEQVITASPTESPAFLFHLLDLFRAVIVYQCAYLHTSQTTREQRSRAGYLEWSGVMRPLYADTEANGNWYQEMLDDSLAEAEAIIDEHAEDLGIEFTPFADDFNEKGRHIFNLHG